MKAALLAIIASSATAWAAPPPDVTAEQAVALYRQWEAWAKVNALTASRREA